jgi:repressor LexA
MLQLSIGQVRVLAAIERRRDQGLPLPTYRELCEEFGWSSTATARDYLRALARKGYIELSGRHHRQMRLRSEPLAVCAIPLVGKIIAGVPVLSEQYIDSRVPVPAEWVNGADYFALRVRGDSMEGAGILEGDCVIVRQQETARDRDIVVAIIEGDTTLKRFKRHGNRIMLEAANPRYKTIEIKTSAAAIQGVVVGLLREYRSRATRGVVHGRRLRGTQQRQARSAGLK